MSLEGDPNVLVWLDELRFSTENYEVLSRPSSCASELSLILAKSSKSKVKRDQEMNLYENLWDFASAKRDEEMVESDQEKGAKKDSPEVKHADVCRVSVVFQDCEEVTEETRPVCTVENIELFLSKDVLGWITDLWYSSEEDEVEEFEEFEKYQQSRVEGGGSVTPRFPVTSTTPSPEGNASSPTVQLRKPGGSLKPNNRISSRSNTIHVVQGGPGTNRNTEQDIQISAPLRLVWRGGKTESIDRGAVVYKNGLLQIQNDTNRSKLEMRMHSTVKGTKVCEFTNPDQSVKISVDKEHQITMGSPRQRRRSVEEDSPKNIKTSNQNVLMKLLRRRSDKHLLEKKGIIKNEDIFGNALKVLYENSNCKVPVPEFVRKAVALIETEKNIKSEHIYRLSGNMATIQKIRLKIDGKNYRVLDEYKNEVDLLTGCLKLFFRELVEPLIPYRTFEELHKLTGKPPGLERDEAVKATVRKVATPHRENILFLVQHLLTVESFKQHNKMTIQSLSIVWGPSILWYPGTEKCVTYSPYEFSMLVNGVLELILSSYQTDAETIEQIQAKYVS